MSGAGPILFDTPRIDRVTLAIGAVDAVTGRLVRDGVSARITGLMDRPIVNASGILVFINLPNQPQYDVEVDGRRAGFPFVERFAFTPQRRATRIRPQGAATCCWHRAPITASHRERRSSAAS